MRSTAAKIAELHHRKTPMTITVHAYFSAHQAANSARPDLLPLPYAPPLTPRAYSLAVAVFAGVLMAAPDRPKINAIDEKTGEHFDVSGRAMRFDRSAVFKDLEIWKRDMNPELWARALPIHDIGCTLLHAAFVRGSSSPDFPQHSGMMNVRVSADCIAAAGLAAVALAYAFEDAGIDEPPHLQIDGSHSHGWELVRRATWADSHELMLRWSGKRDQAGQAADKRVMAALKVAEGWLRDLNLPRLNELMLRLMSPDVDQAETPASEAAAHDPAGRVKARKVLDEIAELHGGRALPYIDKNNHGLTVYRDADLLDAWFSLQHRPMDMGGNTYVINTYELRVIDANGMDSAPIVMTHHDEDGAAGLAGRCFEFVDDDPTDEQILAAAAALDARDAAAPAALTGGYPLRADGFPDLAAIHAQAEAAKVESIPRKPDGSPDLGKMNADTMADFVARDAANGINNPKTLALAAATAAAAQSSNPNPAEEIPAMAKKTDDKPANTNPFKKPAQSAPPEAKPKQSAPLGEKTASMGEPLEMKNQTTPAQDAADADAKKIKDLKEAHRNIVHLARPELTAGMVNFNGTIESITIGPVIQAYTSEGVGRTGKLTLTLKPGFKDVTARALQRYLTVYRDFDGRAAELADRIADDLAAVVKYDRVKVDFHHSEDGLPIKVIAKRGYDSPAD